MKTFAFHKRDLYVWYGVFCLVMTITLGAGYFLGRFEQIQVNRSLLEVIPDVNCSIGSVD